MLSFPMPLKLCLAATAILALMITPPAAAQSLELGLNTQSSFPPFPGIPGVNTNGGCANGSCGLPSSGLPVMSGGGCANGTCGGISGGGGLRTEWRSTPKLMPWNWGPNVIRLRRVVVAGGPQFPGQQPLPGGVPGLPNGGAGLYPTEAVLEVRFTNAPPKPGPSFVRIPCGAGQPR